MYNKQMYELGCKRSVIRDLFEFGLKRKAEIGEDSVFDFSLGNPSVPAPQEVKDSVEAILAEMNSISVHGYTLAQGNPHTRKAVADDLNERFNAGVDPDLLYMTCGAGAALTISLRALNEGDGEIVLLAPFFPEYRVFVKTIDAVPVIVPFDEADFQVDLNAFEKAISEKTKAVIINSPNNPSGVVYSRQTLERICAILSERSKRYGHPIYIVSDEPYRELVFDKQDLPFIFNLYDNSLVCYSYSKSLSIPGERIGYIAVNPKMEDAKSVFCAVCGAGRALGFVCAPSLFQHVVARCAGVRPDIKAYRCNRDKLLSSLTELGYHCIYPAGAFYLFVKALEPDANAFSAKAKDFGLLLVPGNDFAAPGYVRIAYCVDYRVICNSIPAFKALKEYYG